MKAIELKFRIGTVAPLLDLIREVSGEIGEAPVVGEKIGAGEEMEDYWREGLEMGQEEDCEKLLGLFGTEFFEEGAVVLTRENIEPVLRACAALRLRLHATRLAGVKEAELGDFGKIQQAFVKNPKDRKAAALACFGFLCELQQIILRHLNPADGSE